MSPHRWTGWEPDPHYREPEWDWVDRAIITAWTRLTRDACTLCGRPWAIHDTDHEGEYAAGFNTCTATAALDRAQAAQAARDEPARKQGLNPERARQWATWTALEGPPWPLDQ